MMNCIRVVRAARNVTPAFKRGYFTQTFSDKDKFTTELKGDYPTIVEGLEGEFAKELFRYAYNNNQLGYYKVALEYVNGLNAPHRFAEEEFQASLKDAGVPDVVRTEFLSNVSESLLSNNFPEIVAAYEELYKANYRVEFGTITLGTHYSDKYESFKRKIAEISAPAVANNTRVEWKYKLVPADLSGWRSAAASSSIDASGTSALEEEKLKTTDNIF